MRKYCYCSSSSHTRCIHKLLSTYEVKTKIDGTTTKNIEDFFLLGLVLVYNLKIYSYNFSNTTGRLKFYSNEEATYFDNDIADIHGFTHKANILGDVVAQLVSDFVNRILENIPTAASSKYLS